jgi:hypothetical protein
MQPFFYFRISIARVSIILDSGLVRCEFVLKKQLGLKDFVKFEKLLCYETFKRTV